MRHVRGWVAPPRAEDLGTRGRLVRALPARGRAGARRRARAARAPRRPDRLRTRPRPLLRADPLELAGRPPGAPRRPELPLPLGPRPRDRRRARVGAPRAPAGLP